MRIYVGGLPFSTTSDQLGDIFAEFGTVTNAQVIEDRASRAQGRAQIADREPRDVTEILHQHGSVKPVFIAEILDHLVGGFVAQRRNRGIARQHLRNEKRRHG